MPKLAKPLTDIQCRNAKAKEKIYTLADGGAMYLEVSILGVKKWRMSYRQANGKTNRLTFGTYPEVTLVEARVRRAAARKLLAFNIDPAEERDQAKRLAVDVAANTFEKIAREWHKNKSGDSWQPQTEEQNLKSLEKDLFPDIGHLPIASIKTSMMLDVLQKIERRGALEVTKRVASLASSVFKYAMVKDLIEYDPIPALRKELKTRVKGNHAAITVAELPKFLQVLNKNEGRMYPPNRIGLRLMMLTFVRTSELIETPWSEIDLENENWVIPWQRMKMGKRKVKPCKVNHHVFLPKQGWDLLRELHQYTGGNKNLFPNQRDHERPVSNAMILAALKRMGYGGIMTGHGFRSLAKGILKTLGYQLGDIELQLSHASGEAYGSSYDREEFLERRKSMMSHYGNYLDEVANGKVVEGNFSKAAA